MVYLYEIHTIQRRTENIKPGGRINPFPPIFFQIQIFQKINSNSL